MIVCFSCGAKQWSAESQTNLIVVTRRSYPPTPLYFYIFASLGILNRSQFRAFVVPLFYFFITSDQLRIKRRQTWWSPGRQFCKIRSDRGGASILFCPGYSKPGLAPKYTFMLTFSITYFVTGVSRFYMNGKNWLISFNTFSLNRKQNKIEVE